MKKKEIVIAADLISHDLDMEMKITKVLSSSVICFYNPDEQNGYLSNWYLSDFLSNGINFTSMEQYMMCSKAILFEDKTIAKLIMQTSDVFKIKVLGREIQGFKDAVWNSNKYSIVLNGVYHKFSYNAKLCKQLLSTGDSVLAECAVKDTIWGIGLSMHDTKRFNQDAWRGTNLLGKALMEVRDKLKM